MPGIAGGMPGSPNRLVVRAGGPNAFEVGDKAGYIDHSAGECYEYHYGGGGGWGNPLDRPAERVLDDVLDEYVSVEGARRDYGVVLTGSLEAMDPARTAGNRSAASADGRPAVTPDLDYRIGIDVGGTFTDLVLVTAKGALVLDKHPTTPRDQSEGVLGGIAQLAAREGLATDALLARTSLVVHGTTTADNTMIEMSGATTGLLTSEGHRDEIEIRRGYKEDIWDPAFPPPPPICPRRRRYGVPERLDFEGNVVLPLDEEAVRRACRRMQLQGVDSLAVVFLFSFVNPVHERRVREIAAEELPGVMLSLSHEVMPSAPEFERTSTTL
jgi:hypothetical protein